LDIVWDEKNKVKIGEFLVRDINPAFESLSGLRREKALNKPLSEVLPGMERGWLDVFEEVAILGKPRFFERRSNIFNKELETLVYAPKPNQLVVMISDISEKKRAEYEKTLLEDQIQQLMKMEAVGRLAGGVAHDFNNILTGIMGYTEMLLSEAESGSPAQEDLREIMKSSQRAASLTQQLLAFSRRQVIAPKIVDLNQLVESSQKMLARIMGEDVEFHFIAGEQLGSVKVDPGQIDQIIMNLAANARDAMLGGGRLTIQTADVSVDEAYCRVHAEAKPGNYIMLSVSDSGCGLDPEVMEHIFEPFYTTKERGKGTGLGLSTVYGIVKQNSGFISVYTEGGLGTTFKIYLPRVDREAETVENGNVIPSLPRGNETILLVEDEGTVRGLARKTLERQGYKILEAKDGEHALKEFQERIGEVKLLLTDVIMPHMNGKQLYDALRKLNIELKVIFMSGYAEDVIAHHGLIEDQMHFIQKPFTIAALTNKVRDALDTPPIREDSGEQ
jgi:two-component system, cell cycle sensor histidine kinase and response regulator CckA